MHKHFAKGDNTPKSASRENAISNLLNESKKDGLSIAGVRAGKQRAITISCYNSTISPLTGGAPVEIDESKNPSGDAVPVKPYSGSGEWFVTSSYLNAKQFGDCVVSGPVWVPVTSGENSDYVKAVQNGFEYTSSPSADSARVIFADDSKALILLNASTPAESEYNGFFVSNVEKNENGWSIKIGGGYVSINGNNVFVDENFVQVNENQLSSGISYIVLEMDGNTATYSISGTVENNKIVIATINKTNDTVVVTQQQYGHILLTNGITDIEQGDGILVEIQGNTAKISLNLPPGKGLLYWNGTALELLEKCPCENCTPAIIESGDIVVYFSDGRSSNFSNTQPGKWNGIVTDENSHTDYMFEIAFWDSNGAQMIDGNPLQEDAWCLSCINFGGGDILEYQPNSNPNGIATGIEWNHVSTWEWTNILKIEKAE